MSYLAELNGNVKDCGDILQESVKVSIYKKVGEAYTDSNGNYSNINYSESDEFTVKFEKDGFFPLFKEYPLNGILNVVLPKSDPSYPNTPDFFRAQDFFTGDSIILLWGNISFDYIAGYNIYRSTDLMEKFERVNVDIIIENSFIDTGVSPGISYYYILEIVSANSQNYFQGVSVRTSIVGPISILPSEHGGDITQLAKVKIDSAKPKKEGEKAIDRDPNTWWESTHGDGAWIEFVFTEEKYINKFYFKKRNKSMGIIFATLQYWNGTKFADIQDLNYLIDTEYTFQDFIVKTNRLRLLSKKVEKFTETDIIEAKVYGF